MTEQIPAIRVTDPHSRDTVPQSPIGGQSPFKFGSFGSVSASASIRSGSASGSGSGSLKDVRPSTSGGIPIPSPGKLLRSFSSSGAHQSHSHNNNANNNNYYNGHVHNQGHGHASLSNPNNINININNNNNNNNNIHYASGSPDPAQPSSPIDPLSQHILHRTQIPQTSLPALLRPTSSGTSATSDEKAHDDRADGSIQSLRHAAGRSDAGLTTTTKEKKKGVSFLSRIIGGTKKKDSLDDASDHHSEHSDMRPEGMDAQAFTFEPHHPQPPAYIRVRAKHKKERDFDRVFLAQELDASRKHDTLDDAKSIRSMKSARSRTGVHAHDTIWAMQFSKDGRYLAAAGHDKIVRVWAVITSPEDRRKEAAQQAGHDQDDQDDHDRHIRLSAPVFRTKPIREFEGHESTVLDLSWSKNNFLLSSSMDRTVRLWHVSRTECLCTFKHNDFVTSIAFHPKDDRFFLAGSLDSKLRLWSIPDKTVAYWNHLGDMITAVEFTPDGRYAIAGCLGGLCMFYETEGLKYQTQMHVRSAHGKNAKGSKITNIQAIHYPPHISAGDVKLLITSNDSRVRLYNFRDKSLEIKFKGNVNDSSQIRATFSDDAKYVICGSEDQRAYIWTMNVEDGEQRNKRPMEFFSASNTITTCVAFAPTKLRQVLDRSGDPMYDLCNPPPVTLLSKAEAEHEESRNSSRAPTEDGSSPADSEAKYNHAKESPAYVARSTHADGHIIVTADFNGRIKVFRQDCAWSKRRMDNWETSSVFSKATNMRRTASIATRGSSRSLRSAQGSVRTQAPSDRILSWRQGITGAPSSATGPASIRSVGPGRSASPRKSSSQLSLRSMQAKSERPDSGKGSMGPPPLPRQNSSNPPTPTKNTTSTTRPTEPDRPKTTGRDFQSSKHTSEPLGLGLDDTSNLFWKLSTESAKAHHDHLPSFHQQVQEERQRHDYELNKGALSPPPHPLTRNESKVSTLSIERSDLSDEASSDDEFLDAEDGHFNHDHGEHSNHNHHGHEHQHTKLAGHEQSRAGSEVVCRHCGSNSFKAVRSKESGETRLCCTACGNAA